MSRSTQADDDALDDIWPSERLAALHRLAVQARVGNGELRRVAELHALAFVVTCATPAERALLLALDAWTDDREGR